MKVLVTGAGGFVGRHLSNELIKAGHEVFLTGLIAESLPGLGEVFSLDITNREQCAKIIEDFRPDATAHLAGLAHTHQNDKNLDLLFDVNVLGAVNVAREMANYAAKAGGIKKSLLFVSTSFVYGGDQIAGVLKCSESTPTSPRTNYGLSKQAAEHAVRFFAHDNFDVYVARPFNHIGPGQDPSFVVPGFAKRIHEASTGGIIETGNLSAIRDFTDVRDIVRGYRQILERRPKEKLFVFGSGQQIAIKDMLDTLMRISGKNVTSTINQELLRPDEPASYIAAPHLAQKTLGWQSEITWKQSLMDVWNEVTTK